MHSERRYYLKKNQVKASIFTKLYFVRRINFSVPAKLIVFYPGASNSLNYTPRFRHEGSYTYVYNYQHCSWLNLRFLEYYAALSGNSVPTFRDKLSAPYFKKGLRGCPETPVQKYHTTPSNVPEECRFHLHRNGSLKSRIVVGYSAMTQHAA
jgi:hypothetical protein